MYQLYKCEILREQTGREVDKGLFGLIESESVKQEKLHFPKLAFVKCVENMKCINFHVFFLICRAFLPYEVVSVDYPYCTNFGNSFLA